MQRPMPRTPMAIIVAFHSDEHLGPCMAAFGRPDLVVVVDNDGSDATRTLVESVGARYVRSPGNVGFARAVNLGLAELDGVDVLLLNPDARIAFADVLVLQSALHDPSRRLAAVGPALVGQDGHAQAADWPLPSPGQVWADALALGRFWRGRRFVTGAVLLLRAEALAELGGLDERYFLYAEESDWQLGAQRAGWQVAVVDSVVATHVGGASSSDNLVRERYFHTSGRIFALRWYGRAGAAVMRLGSVVAALRRYLLGDAPARRSARTALRLMLERDRPRAGRGHVVQVVRSDGFAGVERYIVDVSRELAQRRWQVTVIGGDPDRMRALLPADVAFRPAASTADVARALWATGRADVVHAHMTAAEVPSALLRRRARGRLVTTRHFAGERGSSAPARLAGRFVAARVDTQLAISEFVASAVDGESVVVPNGVAVSERVGTVRNHTVVLAQRLEVEKDTATAVRAWALSGLGDRDWTMEHYGRGAELASLQSLACELGVQGSVRFCGFVDDVRARLATASIMLATAPAEPFGLAVVEAMAEATAVVAAAGGAHLETVGDDGLLFPPGDAAAAAEMLVRLADAPDERAAIGLRLRARQREHFSVPAHVDRLESVYAG